MSPSPKTFLIVGATGNTGKAVVLELARLLPASESFFGYRILALTRSATSQAAQDLAKHGVEVEEYSWPEITADWLQKRNVRRAFIASHNEPHHFAEESTFHREALEAGVNYVVRISTTAANVEPDCRAYYPRAHWAIEHMLSQPQYSNLQWTSLQPNVFHAYYLNTAAQFIHEHHKSGNVKAGRLHLQANEDGLTAPIDPGEVGIVAARLLGQEDVGPYNHAKLVLQGPTDITGRDIVRMVERRIGTKVEDIKYKDLAYLDEYFQKGPHSCNVMSSIKYAFIVGWDGKNTADTTSEQVRKLGPPTVGPEEALDKMIAALKMQHA
ncbi:nmrA-like protein [Pseudozyma hubeiensis SY62]|uniref:NmrA-like protein n=1 Tax=Pseudozyma hubeiensis (strain SY62) TaxID=1305764 RepID=R9P3R3_PSEHS|nr:nmrA-like protein [Pseudozyma hubeiensis SY62]GAC96093.1 nmrA-like protein [Pseudozyma hubeiensis SY62]